MLESPDISAVIKALDEAAKFCGIEYFLIGRLALDVRLKDRIEPGELTATKDVDFAVMVRNWLDYQALRDVLLRRSGQEFLADAHQHQRLSFRQRLPVDLVPSGEIAAADGKIRWPPDGAAEMNVRGFEDAFNDAGFIDFAGVHLRVASLPGLALLKLLAWDDHRHTRSKDLEGLAAIMKHYDLCSSEDRLYIGQDSDLIEAVDFDFSRAWIRILGRDTGRMIKRDETRVWLLAFLRRETSEPYELVWKLKVFLLSDFEQSLALFESFSAGVRDILETESDHG